MTHVVAALVQAPREDLVAGGDESRHLRFIGVSSPHAMKTKASH